MPGDMAKDPEYIRGYEKAKQEIEEDRKSLYRQGRMAAYREDFERTRRETEQQYKKEVGRTTAETSVATESSQFRRIWSISYESSSRLNKGIQ